MDSLFEKLPIPDVAKRHLMIIYYVLQILFILIYADVEVQPFVYVRF